MAAVDGSLAYDPSPPKGLDDTCVRYQAEFHHANARADRSGDSDIYWDPAMDEPLVENAEEEFCNRVIWGGVPSMPVGYKLTDAGVARLCLVGFHHNRLHQYWPDTFSSCFTIKGVREDPARYSNRANIGHGYFHRQDGKSYIFAVKRRRAKFYTFGHRTAVPVVNAQGKTTKLWVELCEELVPFLPTAWNEKCDEMPKGKKGIHKYVTRILHEGTPTTMKQLESLIITEDQVQQRAPMDMKIVLQPDESRTSSSRSAIQKVQAQTSSISPRLSGNPTRRSNAQRKAQAEGSKVSPRVSPSKQAKRVTRSPSLGSDECGTQKRRKQDTEVDDGDWDDDESLLLVSLSSSCTEKPKDKTASRAVTNQLLWGSKSDSTTTATKKTGKQSLRSLKLPGDGIANKRSTDAGSSDRRVHGAAQEDEVSVQGNISKKTTPPSRKSTNTQTTSHSRNLANVPTPARPRAARFPVEVMDLTKIKRDSSSKKQPPQHSKAANAKKINPTNPTQVRLFPKPVPGQANRAPKKLAGTLLFSLMEDPDSWEFISKYKETQLNDLKMRALDDNHDQEARQEHEAEMRKLGLPLNAEEIDGRIHTLLTQEELWSFCRRYLELRLHAIASLETGEVKPPTWYTRSGHVAPTTREQVFEKLYALVDRPEMWGFLKEYHDTRTKRSQEPIASEYADKTLFGLLENPTMWDFFQKTIL